MSFENIAVLDNRLILIKEIDIRVPISSFIDSTEEQCFTVNIDDPELIHICIFKEALTGYKSEDSGFVYKRFLEKLLQSSKVTIEHKSSFINGIYMDFALRSIKAENQHLRRKSRIMQDHLKESMKD